MNAPRPETALAVGGCSGGEARAPGDCKEATATRFASKCRERSAKARAGVEVTGFPAYPFGVGKGGHESRLRPVLRTRHAEGWQSVARQPAKRVAVACGASRGRTTQAKRSFAL